MSVDEDEQLVRFLCVEVKSGDSQEKLKTKVLRAIRSSEKKTTPITHPLQPWSEEAHSLPNLKANDVAKVVVNSSHVAFLLQDGQVCRMGVASWKESSAGKSFSSLDALRQSQQSSSFQVLGDEEYAHQLQAEFNSIPEWNRASPSIPFVDNSRLVNLEDPLAVDFLAIQRASMPFSFPEENSLTSEWRNAINNLSSNAENVTNMTSRTSGRKGVAKEDRQRMKVWPEMRSQEWLIMKQNPEELSPDSSFVAISAMHSEILLVSSKERRLYSWTCSNQNSPKPHPLLEALGLEGERIAILESSDIRATVVTESGKIATFYDELLRATPESGSPSLIQSLSHPAQVFPELEKETVTSLSVCSFLTCAVTLSGRVYWWGLCPPTKGTSSDPPLPPHRSSTHSPSSTSRGTITDGSLVRLRNGPPCGPNAVVFNGTSHRPRVGRTMNIIEHSGLDPKTSILVKVYKDMNSSSFEVPNDSLKNKPKILRDLESERQYDGLEVWSLSDVVFLDDSPAVLGRVVTVDQLQAIVDISHASSESGTMNSTSSAQSTLKVFKLNEIEPCIDAYSSFNPIRVPGSGRKETILSGFPDLSSGKVSNPSKDGGCAEENISENDGKITVSQHIAGLVQHRPICLLTPSQPSPPPAGPSAGGTPYPLKESEGRTSHAPPSSCVYGYYPLAVKMTDDGPIMLVKRATDGMAFLVCSGHPGFPSFSSSSFVSLNLRDSKPGKSTIEEESVIALDGGFERSDKHTGNGLDVNNSEVEVHSGLPHPSFLKLHKSQAIMLQDLNGLLCPLFDGLRLKVSHGQQWMKKVPVQPYRCITTRTHLVKKDELVLLVVVVPRLQHLMPAVLSGNAAKVDSIVNNLSSKPTQSDLSSLSKDIVADQPSHNALTKTTPTGKSCDDGPGIPLRQETGMESLIPPVKKVKISEPEPESNSVIKDEHVESAEPEMQANLVPEPKLVTLSESEVTNIDFDEELQVLDSDSSVGMTGSISRLLSREVLLEVTVHNSNILHVCVQLNGTNEVKGNGSCPTAKHLSSLSNMQSGLNQDKSFEEIRYKHLQENPSGPPRTLQSVEGCGLALKRLWILERILGCEEVRETVLHLLCSRNSEGHTPFISAISHQNYTAALKILHFLEKVTPSSPVFSRAILKSSSNGLSALHHLFASLSHNFDAKSLTLHVYNLQLNTAQQLLRLFQVRYPSAYKAEIIKKGEVSEGTDGSTGLSEGSGSNDDEGVELTGISPNHFRGRRVRRFYRRSSLRRLPRSHDNVFSGAQHGLVHFSDVTELRAAAREMNGFRIVSSIFRNTGFGATQTISYLNVSLDEPSESNEETDSFTYLPERDLRAPVNVGSIYEFMGGVATGGSSKGTVKHKNSLHKLSSSEVARGLLQSLLSYQDLVTSLDLAGETPLASLVHNPHCIEKLLALSSSDQKSDVNTAVNLSPNNAHPEKVCDGEECAVITVIPNYARGKTSSKSSDTILKRDSNSKLDDNSSSMQDPDSSTRMSLSIMPYVSLGEHADQVDVQAAQVPQLVTPTDNASSQDMDCAPSPTGTSNIINSISKNLFRVTVSEGSGMGVVGGEGNGEDSLVTTLTDHVRMAVENAFESAAQEIEQKVLERVNKVVAENVQHIPSSGLSSAPPPLSAASSLGRTSSESMATPVLQGPLQFGKGSSLNLESLQISSSHSANSHASKLKSYPNDIIESIFSNWPSVATTVLGFDPSCDPSSSHHKSRINSDPSSWHHSSGSTLSLQSQCQVSSVHRLDSFTTNLFMNCSERMLNNFVDTIIHKLNSAINKTQQDSTFLSSNLLQDIDYGDPEVISRFIAMGEVGVAFLVGRRFLSSVVRVLALEHSRVKNRFLEMQQARQQAARGTDGSEVNISGNGSNRHGRRRGHGGGGGGSSLQSNRKISITSSTIAVIKKFSWLAVYFLSQAAETCSYPIRLSISKPLGASSVVSDYQTNSRGYTSATYTSLTSSRAGGQLEGQSQSLMRQLHVRVAKGTGSLGIKNSSLPIEGLFLRPQFLDSEAGLVGSTRLTASSALNNSVHEESSDEELEQNMEGGLTDRSTHTSGPSQLNTPTLPFPIDPTSPPYSTNIHNEVFLDLDSSSSSEGEGYHPIGHDYLEWGGGGTEDDNLDTIYPFAWALDGRRIGESGAGTAGRPSSPNSITAPITFNPTHEPPIPLANIPSIRFGAGFLARTFARFVKDLVDISHKLANQQLSEPSLHIPPSLQRQLIASTVQTLEQTWRWAAQVLDMAEGQLLQGKLFDVQRHVVSLRGGNSPSATSSRPVHSRASRSFVGSTPGEYVSSLLRTRDHEDRDCLPVLDLYGYEHVVYVLDGLLYTLNHWPKGLIPVIQSDQSDSSRPSSLNLDESNTSKKQKLEPKESSKLTSMSPKSSSRFFERSESVTVSNDKEVNIQMSNDQFFGQGGGASLALENPELVGPPNQWGKQVESFSRPLNEEYPLANRPHLLKPFARKEVLFGVGSAASKDSSSDGAASPNKPQREGGSGKGVRKGRKRKHLSSEGDSSTLVMMWSSDHAHQRWHSAISVFAHIFLAEGPGNERSNFLNARAGFASRMARFRHQVTQLYDASHVARDWAGTVSSTLSVRVRRDRLMLDSLNTLQQLTHFHYTNVRVKFDGEDGSGPGVNRGFFASLSNELKSSDMSKSPLNRLGLFFHEPGKQPEQSGLFSPHPFNPHLVSSPSRANTTKAQRRDAFVAIGRFFGLCLWFHYTIPFMVCRHVAKVLLGRPLAWHDLAFYNADLYEGLRQMMLDAEQGKKDDDEFMATYCSYFEAPLPGKFMEPILVELIPGGSKIPVSASRVQEYVRLYSMFMMVGCVQEELNAMKQGLNDVIPNDLLAGLNAEDFQLLLSGGSADITLHRLKSIIGFNHTHGSSRTVCDRFEKMFWRIVSHMSNTQRQQLLYFATGSAALPASVDSSTRMPSVAITLDVIGSRNVDSLPVASTCSQRMCIPLYPSYHILKKKLLQAIQCQIYGLG